MVALAASPSAQSGRPRIGLVLSGGGARGAAHVGVLQVLEELRIPVDVVAGTSMGAVVGGLYASGLAPDEIAEELSTVDWRLAFEDATPRKLLPFRRKLDDERFPIDFELGFRPWRLLLPRGVLQGQRLALILETLTLHASEVQDFDSLFIPFRAVAADIATGEPVVMRDGSLATAMRASMSVPGVFAPVRRGDLTLVDGGIARNLPVDVVHGMGAEVVIAVDIASRLQDEQAIASALGVTMQMISILMLENSIVQKALLREGDVLIEPDLGDLGPADFHRSPEGIAIGRQAASAIADRLSGLSVSEEEFAAWRAGRVGRAEYALPRIRRVRVENDSRLADEAIRRVVETRPGERLDPTKLLEDIARIYGYNAFEQVDFRLSDVSEDEADLLIRARQKSWGPSYLRFALDVEQDFEGAEAFSIGVSNLWYPINRYGGEWRNDLSVGSVSRYFSEYYQPLDLSSRWFVAPSFEYARQDVGVFLQGQRVAEFEVAQFTYALALGRQLSDWGEVRVGAQYSDGEIDRITGDPSIPGGDFEQGAFFARFTYDTLDDRRFPHHGAFGVGSYELYREDLGADGDFETLQVALGRAHTIAAHTLVGSLSYATNLDDRAAIQNQFPIGGFLNLSGLSRNELFGSHAALARGVYYQQLGYREGVPFDVPLYAGCSTELGGAFDTTSDIDGRHALWAGSVFLAADTILGSVFLGYGVAEGGHRALYLFIGNF